MSDDHFTLDVDPESIAKAKRWCKELSNHLDSKGRRVAGTPADIGKDWQGKAAVAVKHDMGVLGSDMSVYATKFDEARKALSTLERHYRDALGDVSDLNKDYADAISERDAALQKADRDYNKAVTKMEDDSETGTVPMGVRRMMHRDKEDLKSGLYSKCSKKTGKLEDKYDDIVSDLKRYTRNAAHALHGAVVLKVSEKTVKAFHNPPMRPGRADFELYVPDPGASAAMAERYTLITAPKPTKNPVIYPASKSDENPYPAGAVSYETEVPEGPLKVSRSMELSADPPVVNGDGVTVQTRSLKIDFKDTIEGAADLPKGYDASLAAYAGRSVKYSITGPPGQTSTTDGIPANPFDPSHIRPGTSVQLDADFYTGYEGKAAYRLLRGSMSYEVSGGITTGVTKLPGNKVQVIVGPHDAVQNALSFGVGTDKLNISAKLSESIKDSQLETATFDLNTPQGRKAYWEMILMGKLPSTTGPGIPDRSTITGMDFTHDASIEAQIAGLKASLNINHSDANFTWETHADGSKDVVQTYVEGDTTYEAHYHFDANGELTGQTYQLRLHNVNKDLINAYNKLYGDSNVTVDHDQNVVLTFDHEDIQQIKQGAYQQIAWSLRHSGNDWDKVFGHEPTATDVKEWIEKYRDDPQKLSMIDPGMSGGGAFRIATAQNDGQVLLPGGVNSYSRVYWDGATIIDGLTHWKVHPHTGPDVPSPGTAERIK